MTRCVRIAVRGRVQGVGFRYATRARAEQLGLAGWVRNRPDGSVEIFAEGPNQGVEALVAWSRHGPGAASVTEVVVAEEVADGTCIRFEVRF